VSRALPSISTQGLTTEGRRLADNRSRLTATSLAESFEARDAFVASGMEVGIQEGFRKLDTLLGR